jgi:hypothetical protein
MPRTSVPAELVAAGRRFEAWRSRRAERLIPPELWQRATELARRHGVHATAGALRLNYYSLRRRVDEGGRGGSIRGHRDLRGHAPTPTFVEIGPTPTSSECVVEIEDAQGTKLRVHLKGVGARDLAMLARSFVGRP